MSTDRTNADDTGRPAHTPVAVPRRTDGASTSTGRSEQPWSADRDWRSEGGWSAEAEPESDWSGSGPNRPWESAPTGSDESAEPEGGGWSAEPSGWPDESAPSWSGSAEAGGGWSAETEPSEGWNSGGNNSDGGWSSTESTPAWSGEANGGWSAGAGEPQRGWTPGGESSESWGSGEPESGWTGEQSGGSWSAHPDTPPGADAGGQWQAEPTGWPEAPAGPAHQAGPASQPGPGAAPSRTAPASGAVPVVRPAGGPPGLNDQSLLTHRRQQSSRGWRRAVSALTLGAVKPGLSASEVAEAEQLRAIRTPIRGCHRIGVVSLKGGIGKTTTAAGLGLALATSRGDGVIAVDANPDAGTLSDRLVGAPPDAYSGAEWVGAHVRATDDTWIAPRSVRDLLAAVSADEIGSATDVMRYVSIAGRLHVLASEQDPETSEAFNASEYQTTAEVISAFYSVMITDTGTGLLHSAMAGMLSMADSLVIITAPSVDGASRAAKTLDWLDAHHYGHLVARAVVAVSHTRPRAQNVDMKVLDAHFTARCRALVHIPYDPHLVAGSVIRWGEMAPLTRSAFLQLAADVADDFRAGWN